MVSRYTFLKFNVLFVGFVLTVFSLHGVGLKQVFKNRFQRPVFMASYPGRLVGDKKYFIVVEQEGVVQLVSKSGEKKVLLDIKKQVCSRGSEEGLLGFAFSPDFRKNQTAYIYYSVCSPKKIVISRLRFTIKNKTSFKSLKFYYKEEKLLSIKQPYSNHNGGMLAFGKDNFLYAGVGDGGSGGDPHGNGQNLKTLLGSIVRIDVSGQKSYTIPASNPFKKRAREIFAYGLRNPWRFSFDKQTGMLIVGDVGQNRYEEIDIVSKGYNYGWNIREANHCFKPSKGCRRKNLVDPIYSYSHRIGSCVIGGYVYRGKRIRLLQGRYIFGDTTNGKIWSFAFKKNRQVKKSQVRLLSDTRLTISSFAEDSDSELYVLGLSSGKIFQLIP